MNISIMLILVMLFLSLSLVGWALMSSTTLAWERYSDNFTRNTDNQLQRLFLFADAKKLLALYVLCLLILPFLLYAFQQSLIVIVICVCLLVAAPRFVFSWLAARRRQRINASLPDGLAQIAGAMRAGATFITAMQTMVEEDKGPLGQEFSLLLREQRLGARLEEALDNLGERVQSEEMDLVIAAALIAQDVGGNLSEILQRLSETIRRKMEMEGKIKSLTAQGVLQGRVVTMLPFLILLALLAIEPEATRPIFTGVLGWCWLGIIIVLQVIGGLMIRKIVRIEI